MGQSVESCAKPIFNSCEAQVVPQDYKKKERRDPTSLGYELKQTDQCSRPSPRVTFDSGATMVGEANA